mgnify:CR=1 FL=1
MDSAIVDKYIETVERESKQHSLDGNISYPYVTGVLMSMLRGALSDNVRMREVIESMIEEAVSDDV